MNRNTRTDRRSRRDRHFNSRAALYRIIRPIVEDLEERRLFATAAKLVFTTPPAASTPLGTYLANASLVVKIEGSGGAVVTGDTSTVSLTLSGPGGTLAGTTSVAAVKGVATFNNLLISAPGTGYTLTATDATDNLSQVSVPFEVNSDSATQLVFTTQPSGTFAAGTPLNTVVVTVEDAAGNTVTTDSSNVTIASQGGLNGTKTVAAVNGVATFSNLIATLVADSTLKATDSADTLLSPTTVSSSAFAITPGPASQLVFTSQPASTVIGVALPNVVVKVEDTFGNVLTGDSSNVSVILTGGGTLGGPLTEGAVNGVATFAGLTLSTHGTSYTLTASDPSDGGITGISSAFNADPLPATLAFTAAPSSAVAGTALSAVTVLATDASSNPVAGASITISVSGNASSFNAGSLTATTNASGVATFSNLKLDTAGAYTLTATDTTIPGSSNATISTGANALTVTAAASAKLAFTTEPPATTTTGPLPTVVVAVEDSFGNVVITDTSTVALTIPITNGLTGTKSVAAIGGYATFANLIPTKVGTAVHLQATDTGLKAASSSTFDITIGLPAQLAFTQQPIGASPGPLNPLTPVTVSIEDAYGNVETNDTSTVSLVITGTQGETLGGVTSIPAIAGVATFADLQEDVADTYTLTASDLADGTLTGTSSAFTLVSPATQLNPFTQPSSSTVAGVAIAALNIEADDATNTPVTGDAISLALFNVTNGLPGVPVSFAGGTTTGITNNKGRFNDANSLVIDTAGTYVITATDLNVVGISVTTQPFTITPAAATQLAFTQSPASQVTGTLAPVSVAIEDAFGNAETGDTSNVTLTLSGGELDGDATVAVVNGVATFDNLEITSPGVGYTLTASDSADGLPSIISAPFAISPPPPPATQVAFIAGPSAATAGVTLGPITIEAEDVSNDPVAGDTIILTVSGAANSFSAGTLLAVTDQNGVATFSDLQLDTAGVFTVTATDSSAPAKPSLTSGNFTINPAAAAAVSFLQAPSSTTAGVAIAPAVSVKVVDQFGNAISQDSISLALGGSSPEADFDSGYTGAVTTGTDGSATFANLTLNTAGAYTLTATDETLSTTIPASFSISAAAAAHLAFIQPIASTVAGAAIALNVQATDAFGNPVAGDSINLTLPGTDPETSFDAGDAGSVTTGTDGIAAFSGLTLDHAGSYTVGANDGKNTALPASLAVSPASPALLSFIQKPTNGVTGAAISPAVTVEATDSFGNPVPNDLVSLVLPARDPETEFDAGYTGPIATGANGIATFAGLTLQTAGDYDLNATDGAVSTPTPAGFSIDAQITAPTPTVATQLSFVAGPSAGAAGALLATVSVRAQDAAGDPVVGDTITLALSGPVSHFSSGSVTAVTGADGIARFSNLTLDQAGNYTVTATDSTAPGALSVTSQSFAIHAAATSTVTFVQEPSSSTAGAAISPAVSVRATDIYGNPVAGDAISLTLPGSDPQTSFTAGYSGAILTGTSGIATFNGLVLTRAGTYSLKALAPGGLSTTSPAFKVSASSVEKLTLSRQPANITAGSKLSPIPVSVLDKFGNAVGGDTVSISISSGPSGAKITGTSSVSVVNGTATFDNLSLTIAGTYTLKFSASGVTVTSSPFQVSAAAAAKLAIIKLPSTGTAGIVLAPAVIAVQDKYGNLVTGSSIVISGSIATGPSGGKSSVVTTVHAVSGLATFQGVTLTVAGTYTFKFTGGGAIAPVVSGGTKLSASTVAKLALLKEPTAGTAGTVLSPVAVQVLDKYGNIVTASNALVSLSIASGPSGAKLAGTTSLRAINGVATFSNLSATVAGTYTFKLTSAGDASVTTTSIHISAAPIAKVIITRQPVNSTAGATLAPIVVKLVDKYGNLVSSNSSVSLAVGSGPTGAKLGGATTVRAVNGVATFSGVSLTTAGNYTLRVTFGALSTSTGRFTVIPAAATRLSFVSLPSSAKHAHPASVQVVLLDKYGNVTASNGSTVSLTLGSHPKNAALSGILASSVKNGVATFNDVIFSLAGTYSLIATDKSLVFSTASKLFSLS